MFCVKCGKTAKVGNFCETCFVGTETLFETKDFRMLYCDLCGIKESDITDEIERRVKTENVITRYHVMLKKVGNKVHATIMCDGTIKGAPKRESKKILVILGRKMCDMHVKLSGGYYEARIQVRGPHKEEIMRFMKKLLPKKSVVNVEALKEGYDIKVMSKASAASAARALRNRFTVKDSYKLVGSKKGQMLYRNYYSIR